MPSLYIVGQWGPEAAERCYGPFVTGTTAQTLDVDVTIFLMMDAVQLMKKGMAEKIVAPGFPPLPDLIDAFLEGEVSFRSVPTLRLIHQELQEH